MRNLRTVQIISVNEIYRIADEEIKQGKPDGIASKAIAESEGNTELLKSLFLKFQYEELLAQKTHELEEQESKQLETAVTQWQEKMQIQIQEISLSEKKRHLKHDLKLENTRLEQKLTEISRWRTTTISVVVLGIVGLGIYIWTDKSKQPKYVTFAQHPPPSLISANTKKLKTAKLEPNSKTIQSDAKALISLGMAYASGNGVAKNETQAALWIRKAAMQGDAEAQDILGYFYANGKGVSQNDAQAVIWYRKSAEQGNTNAQFRLATAYKNGLGIAKDQDQDQALKWFVSAANQGHIEAQIELGKIYEYGLLGAKQDESQAKIWYQRAAKQGSHEALDSLDYLEELGQD